MSQLPQIPGQQSVETFTRPQNCRSRAYLILAGAGGLVLADVLGFFAALRSDPGIIQFHAMTTVPLILALGLVTTGVRSLRAPREVRLTEDELQIEDAKGGVRKWTWDQVTFVEVDTQAVSAQRCLTIHGTDGKPLAKLAHDFVRFDAMVESIKRKLAAHPAPTRAAAQTRKARKTGVFLMLGGVLAWALGGVNFWMALSERQTQQLLKERGVPAVATVTERVIAPDGRTHRIYYRVDDPSGKSDTANVEVNPAMWQFMRVGQQVKIIAVPGRPDISRLAVGQIDDKMQAPPRTMLILSCIIFAMGGFFFVAGILSWRGINVKWDTVGGFRVERIGK